MDTEQRAKIKLECLLIAKYYSTTQEELVRNASELFKLVFQS